MSTSYSTNLALALPATGELSGTWGTTVNTNITNMLDEALGYQAYSATGGADTITIPDGTTGVARSIYIQLNGTGGGSVAVPATKTKMYFVFNNTASAITFKVTGQTGVSIPAAAKMALVSNGTDVIVAQNYFAALTLGAALPVASGGTGLTAGTSGGVLAYTATGTLASSAALAASALVIGGGAGAAPSTTTTGTGVVTALGVNVGTAGAFVVNGGALGSPSSVGTMPAFTLGGTISGGGNQINNVVIGTTTPLAGAFTTVSSTLGANFATSSGSVGVGTASPQALLHVGAVAEAPGFGTTSQMCYVNGTSQPEVLIRETTNDVVVSMYADSTSGSLRTATNHPLVFFTNNTERARINAAGGLAVTGTLSATGATTLSAQLTASTGDGTYPIISKDTRAFSVGVTGPQLGFFGLDSTSTNNSLGAFRALAQSSQNGTLEARVLSSGSIATIGTFSSTGLAVTGTLSATGTLSGGTSGTGYSFSGSAPATSLTLTSGGNLGLGVTPSAWSSIYKAFQIGAQGAFWANATANDVILSANFLFDVGNTSKYIANGYASYYVQNAGEHIWRTAPNNTSGAGAAATFTQLMTLDSSGNLLVGTASPNGKLTVASGATTFVAGLTSTGTNTYTATASTSLANTTIQLFGGGASGATTGMRMSQGGSFELYFGGVQEAGGAGSFVWQGYSGSAYAERMRLDSSGNLTVGTANASGTSGVGCAINPSSSAFRAVSAATTSAAETYSMYSTGASAYRFYVDWGGTISATSIVITAISDQRLKENVRDIDTGLNAIMALKPRRFDWKEGKGQDKKNAAGFIAQEFEEVFPECVSTSKAGGDGIEYKNINHETLIPTLVKAIQEQQALITQLTARITALETA